MSSTARKRRQERTQAASNNNMDPTARKKPIPSELRNNTNGFGELLTNTAVGKFTPEESQTVQQAVRDLCAERHISISSLCSELDGRSEELRGVWCQIAQKLPHRTTKSVYRHAIRVMHPFKRGDWTEEETRELMLLVTTHGKKWVTIQNKLNRSSDSCRNRYREFHMDFKKGPWDETESLQLEKYIKETLKLNENLTMDQVGKLVQQDPKKYHIPWERISILMKNRSRLSCLQRYEHLSGGWKRVPSGQETTTTTSRSGGTTTSKNKASGKKGRETSAKGTRTSRSDSTDSSSTSSGSSSGSSSSSDGDSGKSDSGAISTTTSSSSSNSSSHKTHKENVDTTVQAPKQSANHGGDGNIRNSSSTNQMDHVKTVSKRKRKQKDSSSNSNNERNAKSIKGTKATTKSMKQNPPAAQPQQPQPQATTHSNSQKTSGIESEDAASTYDRQLLRSLATSSFARHSDVNWKAVRYPMGNAEQRWQKLVDEWIDACDIDEDEVMDKPIWEIARDILGQGMEGGTATEEDQAELAARTVEAVLQF